MADNQHETNGDGKLEEIHDEFVRPIRVPVRGRDGRIKVYLVCETSGPKEYWQWLDRVSQIQKDKLGDHDPAAIQTDLIAMCLTDANGAPVERAVIEGWGITFRSKVFGYCQEINRMTAKAAAEEGKDSGGVATSGGGSTSPSTSASA